MNKDAMFVRFNTETQLHIQLDMGHYGDSLTSYKLHVWCVQLHLKQTSHRYSNNQIEDNQVN